MKDVRPKRAPIFATDLGYLAWVREVLELVDKSEHLIDRDRAVGGQRVVLVVIA